LRSAGLKGPYGILESNIQYEFWLEEAFGVKNNKGSRYRGSGDNHVSPSLEPYKWQWYTRVPKMKDRLTSRLLLP
jgi:hypothetical protein